MYFTLPKIAETRLAFSVTAKFLKFFRLSFRVGRLRRQSSGIVNFIERSINKDDVVINIGSGEDDYLYIILKRLGRSGKIIVFESQPELYQHLAHLKKIFKWNNFKLESLLLSDVRAEKIVYKSAHKASAYGAVVINIEDMPLEKSIYNITVETFDNYCGKNNIKPSFLKIDAAGNELKVIKGAMCTLKTYKPKILLKCEERLAGAQNVLETFKYLQQLGYTGFFVLDTIQIPIINFDFNLYQNTCNNFYCNNFIFE